jgi:hypothetical protein
MSGVEVGQINFGGGSAEQFLGDGRWQKFREDERTCPGERYGLVHDAHTYEYIYTRPDEVGGVTTGSYWCDGLFEEREPFPLCPAGGGWLPVPVPTQEVDQ